jgi:hypothetical protein
MGMPEPSGNRQHPSPDDRGKGGEGGRLMRTLLLLAACLLCLVGCNGGVQQPKPCEGKVVMALFDLSSSTQDDSIRQRYAEDFRRILDGCGAGDILVADTITDNPLAQSTFPINDLFEAFHPGTDNPLIARKKEEEHNQKLKDQRDQILARVRSLLNDRSRKITKTKILDAMLLAERVFRTYNCPKKVLVIFSDMVEESDQYNFKRQPPTEAMTEKIIDQEKQAKRMPDLAGVRVYVIGASAGSYQSSSSDQFTRIEHFWQQYVKSAGADLPKERYGAALLKFDE